MKRLIMATMVTAILASSTVWAADNAPVAAQQQNSASSANPENGSSRAYL